MAELKEHQIERNEIHQIIRALSEPNSMAETIMLAAAGIRELLHAERCAIYLFLDGDRNVLQMFRRGDAGQAEYEVIGIVQGPVGSCLESGQTLEVVPDRRELTAGSNGTDGTGYTGLYVPLIARGQAEGVIEAGFRRADPVDPDLRLSVEFLAPMIAAYVLYAGQIQEQTVLNADLEARCWEIRRERSVLANVFDSMPFPFYSIDHDYRLVAVNTPVAQRANCEASRLLGSRCYEAIYQRAEPCPGCRIADSLTAGIMTFRHDRKWQPDGDPTEWEISTYPLRDDHGKVVGAVSLEQDATEKNRMLESLARTAKLAAVEQLAAGVAHEINNPLVAIIANSQLLQRELEPDDSRLESIDLIARAGDRALSVVRALLDLAQQDSFNFRATDVNESIRSAVHLIKHQLLPEAVELDLFLSPELPMIQASQNHLQGMWLNLLFNARDAIGKNQGRIRISSAQQGNYIQVRVHDDGVGIPEEKISRIFEPFYTTKDHGEGTGLGRSACHRIARQHGGKIQVRSDTGEGTEFTVSLPIVT